jgi:hypothetical protein
MGRKRREALAFTPQCPWLRHGKNVTRFRLRSPQDRSLSKINPEV